MVLAEIFGRICGAHKPEEAYFPNIALAGIPHERVPCFSGKIFNEKK